MHWDNLAQDIRYALRTLRRDGGFFLAAVLIIGLGVGANTAIFSVVNALLFRPLQFQSSDRLVWIANDGHSGLSSTTSRVANYRDWARMNRTMESMTAYFAFFDYGTYLTERWVTVRSTGPFAARSWKITTSLIRARPGVAGRGTRISPSPAPVAARRAKIWPGDQARVVGRGFAGLSSIETGSMAPARPVAERQEAAGEVRRPSGRRATKAIPNWASSSPLTRKAAALLARLERAALGGPGEGRGRAAEEVGARARPRRTRRAWPPRPFDSR